MQKFLVKKFAESLKVKTEEIEKVLKEPDAIAQINRQRSKRSIATGVLSIRFKCFSLDLPARALAATGNVEMPGPKVQPGVCGSERFWQIGPPPPAGCREKPAVGWRCAQLRARIIR